MVKELMLALTQASPVRLSYWLCATMCSHTGPVQGHKRLMAAAMRPSHGSFWFTASREKACRQRYTRLPQIRTDIRQCPRLLRYRYPQDSRRIKRGPGCHPERLAVILSAAKDLCARRARPFAALRVTGILSKCPISMGEQRNLSNFVRIIC